MDRKWFENYFWKVEKVCVRKKRFEEEGYQSSDYVWPDETINEWIKEFLD